MEPERGQLYVKIDWAELHRTVLSLGASIRETLGGSSYPTRIVSVGRGGLVPARILADVLGIRRFAYLGVEARRSAAGVKVEPNWDDVELIRGDAIPLHHTLFVDDIADSGATVRFIHDHFRDGSSYAPVAVVFSRHAVGSGKGSPDFVGRFLDPKGPFARAWVVFPYEARESEALFREGVEVPFS